MEEAINKMKTQLVNEIFANDISDKGLILKMYKEYIPFNTKKANNPIKK